MNGTVQIAPPRGLVAKRVSYLRRKLYRDRERNMSLGGEFGWFGRTVEVAGVLLLSLIRVGCCSELRTAAVAGQATASRRRSAGTWMRQERL